MNVRIYLITGASISIVDTRLRLPTETLLRGMQQKCNFNYIANGWVRLAMRCWWASPLLPQDDLNKT